jgi:phospholipid transport system substrate-binding protein
LTRSDRALYRADMSDVRRRSRIVAVVVASVLWLQAVPAAAGPPTDQLRGRIDRVLKILDDPEMRKEARAAERRAAIRAIAGEVFDFEEISRRSLARHWQPRSPAEREEFVRLFGELLERSYVSKLELYSGEKIEYVGEAVDGDLATVRTRVVTRQGTQIPVDYRLFRQGDRWRAYDVHIEGVSLVGNYRAQFNSVIQRSSYEELVKMLRAKRDEPPATPGVAAPVTPAAGTPGPPPTSRPQNP